MRGPRPFFALALTAASLSACGGGGDASPTSTSSQKPVDASLISVEDGASQEAQTRAEEIKQACYREVQDLPTPNFDAIPAESRSTIARMTADVSIMRYNACLPTKAAAFDGPGTIEVESGPPSTDGGRTTYAILRVLKETIAPDQRAAAQETATATEPATSTDTRPEVDLRPVAPSLPICSSFDSRSGKSYVITGDQDKCEDAAKIARAAIDDLEAGRTPTVDGGPDGYRCEPARNASYVCSDVRPLSEDSVVIDRP